MDRASAALKKLEESADRLGEETTTRFQAFQIAMTQQFNEFQAAMKQYFELVQEETAHHFEAFQSEMALHRALIKAAQKETAKTFEDVARVEKLQKLAESIVNNMSPLECHPPDDPAPLNTEPQHPAEEIAPIPASARSPPKAPSSGPLTQAAEEVSSGTDTEDSTPYEPSMTESYASFSSDESVAARTKRLARRKLSTANPKRKKFTGVAQPRPVSGAFSDIFSRLMKKITIPMKIPYKADIFCNQPVPFSEVVPSTLTC